MIDQEILSVCFSPSFETYQRQIEKKCVTSFQSKYFRVVQKKKEEKLGFDH